MPTVTVQLGQCGNQLGAAFWNQLQQQLHNCESDVSPREWFSRIRPGRCAAPGRGTRNVNTAGTTPSATWKPRCICVDSEAKVVRHWQETQDGINPTVYMLGSGGGCGNNWSCGYSLALCPCNNSKGSLWAGGGDDARHLDLVMEGVRKEAEQEAGVTDFLIMSSLAGGTGSGFGSALLEALVDEYPCSTVAAVAVAPGRSGGSDTATQSINSCLALHHLTEYAHVTLLLDNQVFLDRLTAACRSKTPSPMPGIARQRSSGASSLGNCGNSRQGSTFGADVAPRTGRGCLYDVNELIAPALAGILWPLGESDYLARRNSLRQLVSTVAADPLANVLEVAHVAAPDAQLPTSVLDNPWPARIKLLATQLPTFDPWRPTQPVSTSAALVVARGGLSMRPSATAARRATHSRTAGAPTHSRGDKSSSFAGSSAADFGSCWLSAGGLGAVQSHWGSALAEGNRADEGAAAGAVLSAICSSWPRWSGAGWDAHLGSGKLPLWDAGLGAVTSSLTAAVRRSSTGSLMRDVASNAKRLCAAGAYMHWYEQHGTETATIRDAAERLAQLAGAY